MYFVGIDISKYKHDCCIINEMHKIIASFTFNNDRQGFTELEAYLNSVANPDDEMRIGFEATSHYALNLKLFLEESHYSFMEFNPILLSKFKSANTLRRTKTDSVDCLEIARFMMTVDFKPYPRGFYHMYSLKSLVRCRYRLIKARSKFSVAITNILDAVFPEFKPFFNGSFTATALYIIENYPSAEKISHLTTASYTKINSVVRGHFSADRFARLKQLAKDSVGQSNEFFETELLLNIRLFKAIDDEILTLEEQITSIVHQINPHFLTIKGIGVITAATILAECGDINNFANAGKLLAFAGLEPGVYQSGTSEKGGKMVKHGSAYLRYALLNCVIPLIKCNVTFASYYNKKIAEGKSHRVAITHVAKKLVRIIYTLETKGVDYDEKLLR